MRPDYTSFHKKEAAAKAPFAPPGPEPEKC